MSWQKRIAQAPAAPGCYIWQDPGGTPLYIGKARNLRIRLRSYLRPNLGSRMHFLMQEASRLEWIQTENAIEALLLEANLIKKHNPRYNVRLKDDKRYPYICVSTSEPYPMVYLTRKLQAGQRYFGPYTDVKSARSILGLIHKIFPVRKTPLKLPLKKPARPCLNFHIKRCLGPCQGNVSTEDYDDLIQNILLFLEGKREMLESLIKERIALYSQALQFERAALYRDMLLLLKETLAEQSVQVGSGDFDLLALAREGQEGQIVVMEIREGRLLGRKSFPASLNEQTSDAELYSAGLREIYNHTLPPPEIYLPVRLSEGTDLEMLFAQRSGRKTRLRKIQAPLQKKLTRMAQENARSLLTDRLLSSRFRDRRLALKDVQSLLHLEAEPTLMECYDISHTGGNFTVASGVVFLEGEPDKKSYRRYRIRQIQGIDDPASIHEVLHRRLLRVQAGQRPADLYVIDGGETQLAAAVRAATELGLGHLNFIGLAKAQEEIYRPGQKEPLGTDPNRPALRLLRQMRDEAHRFAITFQRQLRDKAMVKHTLSDVQGLGPARLRSLLLALKERSLEDLDLKELSALPGVGPTLARRIIDHLDRHS